jgi:hypothetical protein
MRNFVATVILPGLLALPAFSADSKPASVAQDARNSIVIVFKDGHQQSFPLSDIARIDFNSLATSASASPAGRGRFLGKWKVGDGAGGAFYITLDRDGEASKSIGSTHGTWTVMDGEARISWDDGWHDAIRKIGNKYEKVAFSPGKTFSDEPSNVANAMNTEPI